VVLRRPLVVRRLTAGQLLTLDDAGQREVVAEHRSLPLCFDFLPAVMAMAHAAATAGRPAMDSCGALAAGRCRGAD
jgi:hypothetical protein